MRRIVTIVALMALLVATFAAAAYALEYVYGTPGPDDLQEQATTPEAIYGYGGADDIFGNVQTVPDEEELRGGRGNDFLYARDKDTNDLVVGGKGANDIAVIDKNLEQTWKKDQVGPGVEVVRVRGFDPTPPVPE